MAIRLAGLVLCCLLLAKGLAEEYQTLYPSEGSQTLFYGSQFAWLHYAWIDIGTPKTSFLVALDTGSDLLWLPCDCIQCAPLSAGDYNVLDRELNEYSPSLSSTSKHLPCDHQLCHPSSICKAPKDPCPYIVEYVSPNTSTSGTLVEDKLHLSSAQGFVQASIIFGCGRKQSGKILKGASVDGLLGLGPGNISVPSLLAKAGFIRNSFSICFNENDSGRILFGDQGHATQQSTSFLLLHGQLIAYVVGVESFCIGSFCPTQTRFNALLDTGTSFTFLPVDVYNKVVLEFDKGVNATRITVREWDYCYDASSKESIDFPQIKLTFPKNQTFLIHNPIVAIPVTKDYTVYCLAVIPSVQQYGIIGQNFLIGHRMVFDRENLRFGWSRSSCEDMEDTSQASPKPSTARLSYFYLVSLIWHLLCWLCG